MKINKYSRFLKIANPKSSWMIPFLAENIPLLSMKSGMLSHKQKLSERFLTLFLYWIFGFYYLFSYKCKIIEMIFVWKFYVNVVGAFFLTSTYQFLAFNIDCSSQTVQNHGFYIEVVNLTTFCFKRNIHQVWTISNFPI